MESGEQFVEWIMVMLMSSVVLLDLMEVLYHFIYNHALHVIIIHFICYSIGVLQY